MYGPYKYLTSGGGCPNYLLLVEVIAVCEFEDDGFVALFRIARQRAVGSAVWRLVDRWVSRVRVTRHVQVIR